MSKRIVIVGGGITGLAAAYRLEGSGASVALLESQGQLGGKILTEKTGGIAVEPSAGPAGDRRLNHCST